MQLDKHLSNPREVLWTAAVRVLRYLHGSFYKGITYTRRSFNSNIMDWFVDADLDSNAYSRCSIGGYDFMINGVVEGQTAELHRPLFRRGRVHVGIGLRRLLKSCGAPQPRATTLYEDNRACQLMSESPAHRERNKHIDLL